MILDMYQEAGDMDRMQVFFYAGICLLFISIFRGIKLKKISADDKKTIKKVKIQRALLFVATIACFLLAWFYFERPDLRGGGIDSNTPRKKIPYDSTEETQNERSSQQ